MSHSFANASGLSETNPFLRPFLARRCSRVKSQAETVSQYISVNSSSFMSSATSLPPVRSMISHMAGEGNTASVPVRRDISSAYTRSSSLTSKPSSMDPLFASACTPSIPRETPYAS